MPKCSKNKQKYENKNRVYPKNIKHQYIYNRLKSRYYPKINFCRFLEIGSPVDGYL